MNRVGIVMTKANGIQKLPWPGVFIEGKPTLVSNRYPPNLSRGTKLPHTHNYI